MLNASRLYLPKLATPPPTILDYLYLRFPHLDPTVLKKRVREGKIFLADQRAITLDTPYQHGITLFYYRESDEEPYIPFEERIIFQNRDILVADKPHYLPVTPTGAYVNQCLLSRLQEQTGLSELSPLHRLDMGTAGVVLFSLRKETRHLYHKLFATADLIKHYLAIANVSNTAIGQEWLVTNRMVAGEPWFRMTIATGAVNAITRITLQACKSDRGLFHLVPHTGKKHQLRVHLASLGFPIVNDPLYPDIKDDLLQDYTKPLQLLAQRLSFLDPLTQEEMQFETGYQLEW
jgi:tRNA pseudouridine32 synthase/23S rRNA pseudouridine746 synthase